MRKESTQTKKSADKKIPKKFYKPLSEKKFKSILRTSVSKNEKQLLEEAFVKNENGKLILKLPEQPEKQKKLSGLLNMIHKSRSGVKTFRLVILVILIGAPIIFTVFFLDKLAASKTESVLESLSGTDVTVEGLDVELLKARVSVDKLAFADLSDDMTDIWALDGIVIDGSWPALMVKRFVMDSVQAHISYKVPRSYPAVYPESGGNNNGVLKKQVDVIKSKGFEWFPTDDLPVESLKTIEKLKKEAETVYEDWEKSVKQEQKEITLLIEECKAFVEQPQPDSGDIAGWASYIKQGADLFQKTREKAKSLSKYEKKLKKSLSFTERSLKKSKRALENDLSKIEDILSLEPAILNRWLKASLETYLGPRASEIYSKIQLASDKAKSLKKSKEEKAEKEGRKKAARMKSGRIVPFPVKLPPRFTVKQLDLGGEGISVTGQNLGVDHDLAGSGSELDFLLDGAAGISGVIGGSLLIDGREGVSHFVDGIVTTSDWDWNITGFNTGLGDSGGPDRISGKIKTKSNFFIPGNNRKDFNISGNVLLDSWHSGSGNFAFINSTAPEMGFSCALSVKDGLPEIQAAMSSEYIKPWLKYLTSAFLPVGVSQAQEALRIKASENLSGLENTIQNWEEGKNILNSLEEALGMEANTLDKILEDASSSSSLENKFPDVFGKLKSLF